MYHRVSRFVDDAFEKAHAAWTTTHLERTVFWVQQLDPRAGEALLIAARSHDIERAFRKSDMDVLLSKSTDGFEDAEFLRLHQTRGAEIMGTFLKDQNAPKELIEQVSHLIEHHEDGGNDEQNILKDADTISFFENNVDSFIKKHAAEKGKQKVLAKFRWMYERLTLPEAKEIARPMYEAAIMQLDSAK